MKRVLWRVVFLGVTALAVALELLAAFDGDPDTEPWTTLIVEHVPVEVATAVVGALALWVPVHLGIRYWRRRAR